MKRILKFALVLAFALTFANSSLAQTVTPQGRLTLVSGQPLLTSDVANTSTVYYTPYVGNEITYNTGSGYASATFSQYTLTLSSAHHTAGVIYDVYFVPGASPFVCAGPAWSSLTERGSSAALTQQGPLLVNTNAVPASTCWNGSTYISFVARLGTYLGSIYMVNNGETSVQFNPGAQANGSFPIMGLYNAYNRVKAVSRAQDSNNQWTYSLNTWRPADFGSGQTGNRVWFLDGWPVGGSFFPKASYSTCVQTNTSNTGAEIGIVEDSTTTAPDLASGTEIPVASGTSLSLNRDEAFAPQLGLHYLQAMENVTIVPATFTFFGNACQALQVEVEY